jgi:hypothetical protein
MSDPISDQTKKLRKQYARTFHNDGLIDFFIGWALVSAGIFLWTGLIIFSFLGWMPIVLIMPLKQRFVLPRYGYVKFSKPVKIPRSILFSAGLVLVIGSLLLAFLSGNSGFSIPIAVAVVGVALLLAIDLGLNRVTVYAIFVPLFFILGLGLNILTPPIVILIGVVLMLLGSYLFLNFIRKYPADTDEERENP